MTGREVEIGREEIRELTARLDDLPAHLAREEAVFRRPDMVEAAANAAAGLIGAQALKTAIERLRRNPEIERLEPKKPTAESLAGMAHTEVYSTRHNLGLEQAVRDMAEAMASDTGHALPEQAVKEKVETLLADGYPLSQEQSMAIRHATAMGGRVAVIEGAAGSGKTTTLRPITDLHREHGYEIVPTAVAWRTAVALGDDCDARPYCVDKLLKLAAKGQLDIGRNTLIVVDEAGMLSTRHAHHILQLSERHGAKVVFAGDTRQQQPVEAGPGLRLIRDVAGSVRVDRIRRQKADLEDVLVHVHKETPEQARFRAGLTSPQEQERILADYEAMERKPVFTPWQVAVSEALRDGEAAQAIEAWRLRGRLHLHYDEEKTLTGLVNDWARLANAEPHKSAVVLARTKAEARALSWLMRERVLGERTDIKRAVIEVSRDLDGRVTEPLEIAVGDRLRIGATQWEKQLFNGTVVTVEDIEVKHVEGAAVSRKARNLQAARRAERGAEAGDEFKAESGNEFPVHITARTDDGRRVDVPPRRDPRLPRQHPHRLRLCHDHRVRPGADGGPRVPADRRPALARDRLSRRHPAPRGDRRLRQPLSHRLRHRREPPRGRGGAAGAGQRGTGVPGRALVALPAQGGGARLHRRRRMAGCERRSSAPRAAWAGRRWERRDPAGGCHAWRSRRRAGGSSRGRRCRQRQRDRAHCPGNPSRRQRLAPRYRRRCVRSGAHRGHGRVGRSSPARACGRRDGCPDTGLPRDPRPPRCADEAGRIIPPPSAGVRALLAERAGIGRGEIDEFRRQHARAGTYLRSATARAAHRARQDAERQDVQRQDVQRQDAKRQDAPHEEAQIVEAIAAEEAAPAADPAPGVSLPPRTSDAIAPGPERELPPDWRTFYKELQRDWNDLVARSQEPDLPLLLMDGYDGLIQRVRALSDHPDLSQRARSVIGELLAYHDDETVARETAEGYLAAAERHVEVHKVLEAQAGERGLSIARLDAWPQWRDAAEMLAATGEAVLADDDRYGAWLDAMTVGRSRAQLTVEQLRNRLDDNRERAAKPEVSQRRREPTPKQEQGFAHILEERRKSETRRERKGEEEQQGFAHTLDKPPAKPLDPSESRKGFAHILDDPEKLKELREKAEQRDRKRGKHMRRSRGISM